MLFAMHQVLNDEARRTFHLRCYGISKEQLLNHTGAADAAEASRARQALLGDEKVGVGCAHDLFCSKPMAITHMTESSFVFVG